MKRTQPTVKSSDCAERDSSSSTSKRRRYLDASADIADLLLSLSRSPRCDSRSPSAVPDFEGSSSSRVQTNVVRNRSGIPMPPKFRQVKVVNKEKETGTVLQECTVKPIDHDFLMHKNYSILYQPKKGSKKSPLIGKPLGPAPRLPKMPAGVVFPSSKR